MEEAELTTMNRISVHGSPRDEVDSVEYGRGELDAILSYDALTNEIICVHDGYKSQTQARIVDQPPGHYIHSISRCIYLSTFY
jgi:hypothetical protein